MAGTPDVHPLRGIWGRFVPEALMEALDELQEAFDTAKADPVFGRQLAELQKDYVGRPSPLTVANNFSEQCGGATILLKREDLNHTGSHKINNVIGQALLAQRMGKPRLIAETGAGQHGVATATAAALFGQQCRVYMGQEDTRRQALNVARMELLGAEVVPVAVGTMTLKDAINEALRDWVTNVEDTHYLLGTVTGPAPFPEVVRHFQSIIGQEARDQVLARIGRLPDAVVACVGGGSNAMGIFSGFLEDRTWRCGDTRWWPRCGKRRALGEVLRRLTRCPARRPHLHHAGRVRTDPALLQHQRGARLPRRGSAARAPLRDRPRQV